MRTPRCLSNQALSTWTRATRFVASNRAMAALIAIFALLATPRTALAQNNDAGVPSDAGDAGTRQTPPPPPLAPNAAGQTIQVLGTQVVQQTQRAQAAEARERDLQTQLDACNARARDLQTQLDACNGGTPCSEQERTRITTEITTIRRDVSHIRRDLRAVRAELREVRQIAENARDSAQRANDGVTRLDNTVTTELRPGIQRAQETADDAAGAAEDATRAANDAQRTADGAAGTANATRTAVNQIVPVVNTHTEVLREAARLIPVFSVGGAGGGSIGSSGTPGGLNARGTLGLGWFLTDHLTLRVEGSLGIASLRALDLLTVTGMGWFGWQGESGIQVMGGVGYTALYLTADQVQGPRTLRAGNRGGLLDLGFRVMSGGPVRAGGQIGLSVGELGPEGSEERVLAVNLAAVVQWDINSTHEISARMRRLRRLTPVAGPTPHPAPQAPATEEPASN